MFKYFRFRASLVRQINELLEIKQKYETQMKMLQSESNNFYRRCFNWYEDRKLEILSLDRKHIQPELKHKLIIETNILAQLLGKEEINEDSLEETCTAYPNFRY